MKRIVILVFVALLLCPNEHSNAEGPSTPASSELKRPGTGEAPPSPTGPGRLEKGPLEPGIGDIFFASGTVSADDKYLYVIFDRFLMQYNIPALDLKRKIALDIAVAPITPSISISKDSKFLYIIYNGILYQIDATKLKIEKQIKITP